MNAQEKFRELNITDGPSKDTLLDAFKYAYDKRTMIPTSFKLEPKGLPRFVSADRLRISKIMYEDGSGGKFCLEDLCRPGFENGVHRKSYRFWAYYDTKARKGVIRLYY